MDNPYFIVGAGAIGGTIGAYMLRGGVDVTFVDTDVAHVEAINRDGLTIRGFAESFTVPARAVDARCHARRPGPGHPGRQGAGHTRGYRTDRTSAWQRTGSWCPPRTGSTNLSSAT